jgi:hypothetical protein
MTATANAPHYSQIKKKRRYRCEAHRPGDLPGQRHQCGLPATMKRMVAGGSRERVHLPGSRAVLPGSGFEDRNGPV